MVISIKKQLQRNQGLSAVLGSVRFWFGTVAPQKNTLFVYLEALLVHRDRQAADNYVHHCVPQNFIHLLL
jgi:hypothetical protein